MVLIMDDNSAKLKYLDYNSIQIGAIPYKHLILNPCSGDHIDRVVIISNSEYLITPSHTASQWEHL